MFGGGIRIGSVFGIEIRIDGSWVVIALLIAWGLYAQFRMVFEDLAPEPAAGLGIVTAALFFGSVLLHELSHSVVARSLGIPVAGITLFLFGGVTQTKLDAQSPGDEFKIAIVGPVTSIILAAVFWLLTVTVGAASPDPIAWALGYLGWINLALGIFNLLPGFPLDGGRVLRSILWKRSGSVTQATKGAARGGQIVAIGMIAIGLVQVFSGYLGGLWLAAIGWFLYQAAGASAANVVVRRMLRDLSAGDLMSPNPVTIPAGLTLADAVDHYFLRYDHSAFPVDDDGVVTGLLTLRAVRHVPRDQWDFIQVWRTMAPLDDIQCVASDLPMDQVLEQFESDEIDRVLVMDDGRVLGIITPRDVARWVQRSQELGITSTEG
jgi:Zn-dependent protease/CBS domain-containing protein